MLWVPLPLPTYVERTSTHANRLSLTQGLSAASADAVVAVESHVDAPPTAPALPATKVSVVPPEALRRDLPARWWPLSSFLSQAANGSRIQQVEQLPYNVTTG